MGSSEARWWNPECINTYKVATIVIQTTSTIVITNYILNYSMASTRGKSNDVRNNLLNASFLFQGFSEDITFSGGEISWHLLNCVYERDSNLQANLRKAPKLTYETLHPGNKKQSVQLALNIFHETTTAAISSYFPDREDATEFIRLINTWWNIHIQNTSLIATIE